MMPDEARAWRSAFRAARACGCAPCHLFGFVHRHARTTPKMRLGLMRALHAHLGRRPALPPVLVNGEPVDLASFGRALRRNRRLRDSWKNRRTYTHGR